MIWLYVPPGTRICLTTRNRSRCRSLGKDGTGRPEMTASTWEIPQPVEDRGQVADVPLDDVEVGVALEPLAEDPGEVGVAFQDHDPAIGTGLLGQDLGDRPGAGAQLDHDLRPVPVDVADRRPRQPGAARRQAGDRRPMLEELAQEQQRSRSSTYIEPKGDARRPTVGPSRQKRWGVTFRLPRVSGVFRNRAGSSCGGDGLQAVAEVAEDELIDQPRLLDLGGMAALGDDDLADLEDLVGGPDRPADVGDHVVVGPPDDQGRVGDLVQERGHGVADGPAEGPDDPLLPLAVAGTCAR